MQIPDTSSKVQKSLMAICLFAAFSDGEKSEAEQETLRKIGEDLNSENISDVTRRILMRKLSIEDAVAGLETKEDRMLAYEMALSVCEAGGLLSPEENEFLKLLREKLSLGTGEAQTIEKTVSGIAGQPLVVPSPVPAQAQTGLDHGDLILRYAILNGALELLPETMATMAIIPLQMKMVYSIGKDHGVELDRAHIKEFLAVAGAGLGSQMVEGFARQLIRGLSKKMAGKFAGKAADQITGSAFSFASTYAIGFAADKYYMDGRRLDAQSLRELFTSLQQKARELHTSYMPQIRERAGSLNSANIISLVTGSQTA